MASYPTELDGLRWEKNEAKKAGYLILDRAPMKHREYREQVIEKQIALMYQRGIWKKSSYD